MSFGRGLGKEYKFESDRLKYIDIDYGKKRTEQK